MKNILKKKLITIGSLFVIAIFAIILFLLLPLSDWKYSNKEFSPDGEYYAQVSESNGGATTAYSSGVSIFKAKSKFNNLGIISNWLDTKASVFGLNGSLNTIKTSWTDDRTLKITYTSCRQIYGQNYSWNDVKIIYEEKCSSSN